MVDEVQKQLEVVRVRVHEDNRTKSIEDLREGTRNTRSWWMKEDTVDQVRGLRF
jgi:hypothetical protein